MGNGFVPDEPVASSIYRGFILRPPTTLDTSSVASITYQVQVSNDNANWSDWQDFAVAFRISFFSAIHDGLYTDLYYQYRCKVTYTSGAFSEYSDYTIPGNGVVNPGVDVPVSALDQLAASLGTITSGFLRGVVFETSPNYPKVRFDPNGFYAINNNSTPLFIDAFTGDITVLGGRIRGATIESAATPGSRIMLRQEGLFAYTGTSTPIAFNTQAGSYTINGHIKALGVDFVGTIDSDWDNPNNDNMINFRDSGTGDPLGEIYGGTWDSFSGNTVIVQGETATDNSAAFVGAKRGGTTRTFIGARENSTGYGSAGAVVSGIIKTVLDTDGNSSFVQYQAGSNPAKVELWGPYHFAYSLGAAASGSYDVDVDFGAPTGTWFPFFTNAKNAASDRLNMPTYEALDSDTVRVTISTDYSGGCTGDIYFIIVKFA